MPEETFTIVVPAIVDAETWDTAQVQMEYNARKAKRNGKREYLLTGIVRCGCGHSMTGYATIDKKTGKGHRYYRCCWNKMHYSGIEKRRCKECATRADWLEAAAWDAILDVMTNPAELEAKLRKAQQAELEDQEPQRAELETVITMLAEAEAEAGNLATTFAQLVQRQQQTGAVGRALQEKINTVDERHKRLTARRDALEAALANRRLTDQAIAGMLAYARKVEIGLEHATNNDKRHVLDAFDARVFVKGGTARLEYDLNGKISIELQPLRHAR